MWNSPDSVGVKKILGKDTKTQRDLMTRSKNYIKKQQKKNVFLKRKFNDPLEQGFFLKLLTRIKIVLVDRLTTVLSACLYNNAQFLATNFA